MTHRPVRAVMTAAVATVSPDTPFKALAVIMAEHGLNVLPVLDTGGRTHQHRAQSEGLTAS
jgi:CBS domain-containing protein